MAIYYGCDVPEDLYFDVKRDVWLRFEDGPAESDEAGLVTLGMTDLAQTRCGKLVSIRFKKVGKLLRRGRSAATIESAKWVGPFPMPLSGELVATNEAAFDADILIANRDPYGAGWLVKIRPTDLAAERGHLLAGQTALEAYRQRIEELEVHCFRCAD
jgi:glycine cleavage system H protein